MRGPSIKNENCKSAGTVNAVKSQEQPPNAHATNHSLSSARLVGKDDIQSVDTGNAVDAWRKSFAVTNGSSANHDVYKNFSATTPAQDLKRQLDEPPPTQFSAEIKQRTSSSGSYSSEKSFSSGPMPPPIEEIPASIQSRRKWIFLGVIVCNVFVNFDSGVIPCILGPLQEEFDLTYVHLGLMGGFPYVGISIASPIWGQLFMRFSEKRMLITGIVLNAGSCVLLACARWLGVELLLISRILIGMTQSGFICYGPVWISKFAPGTSQAAWQALFQVGGPLGVMSGYAVAGVVVRKLENHWSWAIWCQVCGLGLMVLLLLVTPKSDVDAGSSSSGQSVVKQLCTLLRNSVWSSLVWTLCALYFVVTGIQFWATEFFLTAFESTLEEVLVAFTIVAATGPTLGLVFGGFAVSWMGGYLTKTGQFKTARFCFVMGLIATGIGFVAGISYNFYLCVACIWLTLFFGGAIVPAANGMLLEFVKPEHRVNSSAIGQVCFNIGGYALGAYLPGMLMDSLDDVRMGVRAILAWSVFGVLGCLVALCACFNAKRKEVAQWKNAVGGEHSAVCLGTSKIRKNSQGFTIKQQHSRL